MIFSWGPQRVGEIIRLGPVSQGLTSRQAGRRTQWLAGCNRLLLAKRTLRSGANHA